MKGLDTNILMRHFTQDDAAQAQLASQFIGAECTRDKPCFINRVVLCEMVWVLESGYAYSRKDISQALERVFRTHEFSVEDVPSAWAALRMYRSGVADFADYLIGETNRAAGCTETVTLDKKAARAAGLRLLST